MLVIPAIDIKNGRCVRLRQGDLRDETVYSDDPAAVAQQWERQGAKLLHLVDLDGAVEGRPRNWPSIEAVLAAVRIPVQVGGGGRSLETVREYMQRGVQRIVLGTAAIQCPDLVSRAGEEFPGRIWLGLDARQGRLALDGWTRLSDEPLDAVLDRVARHPLGGLIFTDIARDGMLSGPNLPAFAQLAASSPLPVIASGGITKLEDLVALRDLGPRIVGAIVGKALYEGRIALSDAIEVVQAGV